jgi:hypothetical protein
VVHEAGSRFLKWGWLVRHAITVAIQHRQCSGELTPQPSMHADNDDALATTDINACAIIITEQIIIDNIRGDDG